LRGSSLLAVIAFRGGTLIDGTGAPPVPDALLVISEGRVAYAGVATPQALGAVPAGAPTVSLAGRWIVPGLVDAHVHAESDADLRQMLRWGVTAVRLMAEDVAASREIARRAALPGSGMPDVFPSAPIFTVKGGWWGRGEPPDAHLDRFPATPGAARAAVREAKALGAREIKLMLDDMAWCRAPLPALPRLDPEIARALIEEARSQGLRAIVHAPGIAEAKEAIEDGATALAHGVLEPLGEETMREMLRGSIAYVPTMDVFEFLADTRAFVESVLADPVVTGPGGLPPEAVATLRAAGYAAGYRERYPNFANVQCRLPREPSPAPCRRRSRRARHRHVGLSRARGVGRDGPLREGRPDAARGDPGGHADRGAIARDRGQPRDPRAGPPGRLPRARPRSARRRPERAADRRRVQAGRARGPGSRRAVSRRDDG
jgi:imidazolonepropionase-like amidohydrolase